jgi:hypothetical protein
MRISISTLTTLVAASSILLVTHANAEEKLENFHAVLSGFEEIGALNNETGAIFSGGKGALDLILNDQTKAINYTLTYSGLSAGVLQAHIHLGKRHVPGGVMVFFCSNLGNGPAGTPLCPTASGTVSGMWTPASVQAIAGQNVTAGDFEALVAALRSDTAYGNIHTANFKAGEIRGQIRRPDRD